MSKKSKVNLSKNNAKEKSGGLLDYVTNKIFTSGDNASDVPLSKKKFYDPMAEGVRWSEKYSDRIEKFWGVLPEKISTFIATLAIFTFGATIKGEWVVMIVTALKQWNGSYNMTDNELINGTSELFASELKMDHLLYFWVVSNIISYGMYFGIGGFLHWYFYVNRRDKASEWKLQPDKWLSPELELNEIMMGSLAIIVTGTYSSMLACYIYNGNPSTIYYQFDEYGWFWFFLQFPAIFIYQDYTTYVMHRLYHTPFLYKNFHKMHHKYKQPTAFSVTAIHPVEILHIQLTMCLPLFTVPVHWLPFYVVVLYTYYHGIIDHSGINFKAQWWQPWQPDAKFHDLHHEFFHVNFGFNISIWDKIHGTTMKKNKVYNEETFHNSQGTPQIETKKVKNN